MAKIPDPDGEFRRRIGRPAHRKAQEYAQIVDHRFEDAGREPPPGLRRQTPAGTRG